MVTLDKSIYDLLNEEPFYAHFIMNSKLLWDKSVPTAYATVNNHGLVLGFNPDFVQGLTQSGFTKVLKHEILHLLFKHVELLKAETKNQAERHNWNIAMDCVINQYIHGIEELGEGIVTLENFRKAIKNETALAFQTSKYYYDLIQQAPESCKQKMVGLSTVDDHSKMEEGDGQEGQKTDAEKELEKAIISSIAQEAVQSSAGKVPNGLIKHIESLKTQAKHNWKQILRNFIANSTSKKTIGTRKKSNRRFGFEVPGKKKKNELKIGVCIDTSGSVSDKMFNDFMSEILDISKNISEAHLIYADTEVQKVVKITDQKHIPMERYGCGGTAYGPAIEKALELKVDAILYLGDADCADKPTDPKKPFLWVIHGNQEPPGNFGKVLRLN